MHRLQTMMEQVAVSSKVLGTCCPISSEAVDVRLWIPELQKVPTVSVHNPCELDELWTSTLCSLGHVGVLPEAELEKLGASAYPSKPVVEQKSWKSHYERKEAGSSHEKGGRKGGNRRGPQKNRGKQ